MSDPLIINSTFETRFVPDEVLVHPNSDTPRDEQGAGHYVFGAVIDGVFVAFASRKGGGVNADLERAKKQRPTQLPPSVQHTSGAPAPPEPPQVEGSTASE